MFSFIPRILKSIVLALPVCCIVFSTASFAQTGSWTALTNTAPHYNDGAMLLLTDGTVLCKTSSGGTGYGTKWDRLTPVNGSYVNGTWTTIAAMAKERLYFSCQILPDGRFYVCGGEYGAGGTAGEIYNPITNTWTTAGGAGHVFADTVSDANSELLPDGKVLQACVDETGVNLNFLWNPVTNTYTAGPSCLQIDNEAVWIKLPDSSVIFMDNYDSTSERYIPATNTWIADATAAENLYDPYGFEAGAGFLLPDGRVFFIGSLPNTLYYTPSGTTANGTWANGPSLPSSQGAPDAAAAMMPNGKILLTLSPTPTAANNFPSPTAYYEFDYTTNTFTQVGAPGGGTTTDNSTYISNMLDLPDGTVLFANQGDDQYYEYVPGTGPLAAGTPTISAVNRENCDTFQVTGMNFNGITEGAAYGDDWQESTNYPIVRLTSGTNTYYATTYNWNRIGAVMTGTLPDTAIFKLPAGLAAGTYSVTVIVNGNPSLPYTINTALTITPATATLCPGQADTLTDVASIGTWSSANSAIASVNSTTGVVTGVGTGTTTITYSEGTCASTASVTVNNSLPALIGTPAVCLGGITTFSDVVTGGTWTSNNPTNATVDGSGNVSGLTVGTATISYSALSGCSASKLVTVDALPVATITAGGSTTFCLGSNVTLNATAGAGLTYQWQSGGTNISGATSAAYVASTAGNYRVEVTNANGCTDTSAITVVTTTAGPGASITPVGATTFCTGGNVLLNANTGVGLTYQWQQGGASISGATSASYTAATGGGYDVIVHQGVCAITSATTTVTVDNVPVVAAIGGAASGVCTGQTITLTEADGGGTWVSSNTSVASVDASLAIVGGLSAGTTNITYTLANTCGTASVSATVTVNTTTPTAAVTGASLLCVTNSTILTDATGSGTWSSSDNSIASVTSSGQVTGVGAGTDVISYSATNTFGCTSVAVSTITVTPQFTASVTPEGSTTFCTGADVLLEATAGSGYTYQWMTGGTDIAGATLVGYHAATAGDYTVLITNASGCKVTSAGVTVVVNTGTIVIPAVSINASLGTTICAGAPPSTFTALPVNGGSAPSYQWFVNGTSVGTGVSYTYSPAGGDVISCRITSNAPCAFPDTASGAITMNIGSLQTPSVTISAIPADSICAGDTVAFTANGTYGGTAPAFLWTKDGINVATGPEYLYAPHAGDSLIVTMTSDYPCLLTGTATSARYYVQVLTPSVNSISVSVSQSTIITGSVDTFTAVASGAGTSPAFQWYINGVAVAGATQAQYITDSLKNGQVVNCKETSSFACSDPMVVYSNGFNVFVTSGVNQVGYNQGNFTLVPNPNNGIFTVKGTLGTQPDDNVTIVVTNVLGQSVYKNTTRSTNGNVDEQVILPSTVAAGTYQVSVTAGAVHAVFHVVIDK